MRLGLGDYGLRRVRLSSRGTRLLFSLVLLVSFLISVRFSVMCECLYAGFSVVCECLHTYLLLLTTRALYI